jgi:mono/diheme cytochrome c family protein
LTDPAISQKVSMLESLAMPLRRIPLLPGLLLAGAFTANPMQDTKTVWNGIYTEDQAAQGRAPYEESCSRCHGADLSGNVGTSLKGDTFIRDWGGKTLAAFYERMRTTMPRGAPQSLSDSAYLNIVAYVLRANGFPANPTAELKLDLLQSIRVESREGPDYVPNSALVDAVGCLRQNSDKVWILANATNVTRVLEAGPPTPEILSAAALKEPGKGELRLLYIVPSPDALRGHKVYSKGFLIRDPKGDSINVTFLQTLDPACK